MTPRAPGVRLLLWYLGTRAAAVVLLVFFEWPLFNDTIYWLIQLDRLGPALAFPEYPWPAVALLYLPMLLGIPTVAHYVAVMALIMLAADALLTWLLWRAGGRAMSEGLLLWLAAFPALGPFMLTRFDILPAALAAAALLAVHNGRAATAGVCAALGAGIKLWPAFCLPALLVPGNAGARARLLGGLLGAGLALALATAAAAGIARLWSPLASQLGRSLQFEALAGLPFMWLRWLDGGARWAMQHSTVCNCHEIAGPGVDAALHAGTALAIGGVAALAWLHVRAFRAPAAARGAVVAALLASLAVLLAMLTSRVFSSQYMIWLLALLATLGALPGTPLARRDVLALVVACVLTHLVYPLGFSVLLEPRHPLHAAVLLAMTLRDALLLVLAARLCVQAWRACPAAAPAAAAAPA